MTPELDQYIIRKEKRSALIKRHVSAYPSILPLERTHSIADLLAQFESLSPKGPVSIAGRIKAIRLHGDLCFADCEDSTGQIQLLLSPAKTGTELYEFWKTYIDIGDIVNAQGELTKTTRGEMSIQCSAFALLAKSLIPLPDKRKGLKDVESRFRHRELDLITNEEITRRFRTRSRIVSAFRKYLDERQFVEVETPILQSIPGGANARPFRTHHEALNVDFYLRVAPELYLKRLLVGGFERVYEIGRCFRNEGIDRDHSPEFTQVEFYAAFTDYRWMMRFTEDCLCAISASCAEQDPSVRIFKAPFNKIAYSEALQKYAKINLDDFPDRDSLAKAAKSAGVDFDRTDGRGKIIDAIFKHLVRPKLLEPTFVYDHPVELSPLAKKRSDDPRYVERFQLLIDGTELANAFSELNDPIEQSERFAEQQKLRDQGDGEAQSFDQTYIDALNLGMPPAAGIGIGIDRLTAIMTGAPSLREVILFPTLRDSDHA